MFTTGCLPAQRTARRPRAVPETCRRSPPPGNRGCWPACRRTRRCRTGACPAAVSLKLLSHRRTLLSGVVGPSAQIDAVGVDPARRQAREGAGAAGCSAKGRALPSTSLITLLAAPVFVPLRPPPAEYRLGSLGSSGTLRAEIAAADGPVLDGRQAAGRSDLVHHQSGSVVAVEAGALIVTWRPLAFSPKLNPATERSPAGNGRCRRNGCCSR